MASISSDPKGRRTVQFVGGDGKRRSIRLGKVPQRLAEAVKSKVEALNAAAIAGVSWDKESAAWVGALDTVLYEKLAAAGLVPKRAAPESTKLAAFIAAYIKSRSDVKGSTATVYGHTERCLVKFFGANKDIDSVTAADADDFRRSLGQAKPEGEGLAQNTISRRCGIAKQFFRAAKRRKLIAENPFAEMKGITVRGNRAREFFITREMADKVLDACPDAQWRLLFALSRFGGLRCPSEHLTLRWCDIHWSTDRFTVHSPKTEHHEGGESRVVPIFPELRPYLEAVFDAARPGTEFVLTMRRDATANLRTRFTKIIRRAGLKPWPKLFQNLRSTRETELAESLPIHVVCDWVGNSEAVAKKHYLQVTEDHFRLAIKAVQNPVQLDAETAGTGSHGLATILKNPGKTRISGTCASIQVGDEGLEPPTLSV
jgi:integrase